MIASAKPAPREQAAPSWHQTFLNMLPAIRRHARIAFRHLNAEARDEMIEEVFEPFYSTKSGVESSGLGLGISRQLAESFGGTLHAEPDVSPGARLVLMIPVPGERNSEPGRSHPTDENHEIPVTEDNSVPEETNERPS